MTAGALASAHEGCAAWRTAADDAWQSACDRYRATYGVDAPAIALDVAYGRFVRLAELASGHAECTADRLATEAPGAAYLELLCCVRAAVAVGAVRVRP